MTQPHDMDARALKARLETAERLAAYWKTECDSARACAWREIRKLEARNAKLEAVAHFLRRFREDWNVGLTPAMTALDALDDGAAPEQLANEAGDLE